MLGVDDYQALVQAKRPKLKPNSARTYAVSLNTIAGLQVYRELLEREGKGPLRWSENFGPAAQLKTILAENARKVADEARRREEEERRQALEQVGRR